MPKYITFVSTLAYFKIALREYITSSHHITFITILYIITCVTYSYTITYVTNMYAN